MLERAGYKAVADATDLAAVRRQLPEVEACARETFIAKRNTVKHNRGTDIFEAGNIRFGLEMRRQRNGDGGLALHVLADVGGRKARPTSRKPRFWRSTVSGRTPTTTMARATRTTGPTGT